MTYFNVQDFAERYRKLLGNIYDTFFVVLGKFYEGIFKQDSFDNPKEIIVRYAETESQEGIHYKWHEIKTKIRKFYDFLPKLLIERNVFTLQIQ